ncbi:sigma-70 family RNA polymerase sigma factor (plasmid) [Streptomyces goshikiensis]|uniref:RNA polymerase sigma factor n=1 Tax=Streptomyces goshikiensis TaxID=1942 RepID=UPI002F918481|nr:sigma-70 family RNA polymerase sigma factor [Streptomyces goshikiensis]
MVGDGLDGESATLTDVAQRLLDLYPWFSANEPFALQRCFPRLSLASCQDAVQEAFLATGRLAAAGRLPQSTDLVAYLRRAARNRAMSDVRRQARADRRLAVKGGDAPAAVATAGVLSSQDLLEDLVIPAIRSMKESRRRRVVELQSCGWSDDRIAKELGIPLSRLYRDRYEAVRYLRRKLTGHIQAGLGKNNQHGKKGD